MAIRKPAKRARKTTGPKAGTVTGKKARAVAAKKAGRAAPRVARKAAGPAARKAAGPAARKVAGQTSPEPVSAKAAAAAAAAAVAWLKQHGTQRDREGMARYGLPSDHAFGVSVGQIQALAKRLGRSHELAAALWDTGWYEARMLASFVDEPARVTPAQMDRWCRDFDNWGICDTVCFHLFDRTPHAWAMIDRWSDAREEFVKRAAFALIASLALHDKQAADAPFLDGLRLIQRAADDERNFVKKGVSWALRGTGRRNPRLHGAAVAVAKRLSASPEAAARWVGKDALRELTSPAVVRKLAARRSTGRG
jgi:3-methyladenine DNA glycosylase AlkD